MGINLAKKEISRSSMKCYESASVLLTLAASSDITANPVDIMLVLDRSGSMDGKPFTDLKAAANEFVNVIANATNNIVPPPDADTITGGSHIGVVSFGTTATLDLDLSTDVSSIQDTINGLVIDDLTNHRDAFETATQVLQGSANKKYIILITDGNSTAGAYGSLDNVQAANAAASAARAAGITIFCIGLGNGISKQNLITWADSAARVLISPTSDELDEAFEALAANIINPAPENIVVVDTLNDEFEIEGPIIPNNPSDTVAGFTIGADKKSITWTLDKLGVSEAQTATLLFNIKYVGTQDGSFTVNKSITYTDKVITTPGTVKFITINPSITMDCDKLVQPACNLPCYNSTIPCCGGLVDLTLPSDTDSYTVKCAGTFLNLYIRFKNICPNRQMAIGVIVCEEINGIKQPVAYRITSIITPAYVPDPTGQTTPPSCGCQEFTVPLQVVLPDRLLPTGSTCTDREVSIQVISHYMSTNTALCSECKKS